MKYIILITLILYHDLHVSAIIILNLLQLASVNAKAIV